MCCIDFQLHAHLNMQVNPSNATVNSEYFALFLHQLTIARIYIFCAVSDWVLKSLGQDATLPQNLDPRNSVYYLYFHPIWTNIMLKHKKISKGSSDLVVLSFDLAYFGLQASSYMDDPLSAFQQRPGALPPTRSKAHAKFEQRAGSSAAVCVELLGRL